MPQNKWTINSAGGGGTSSDLIGCHIKQTATGYDFTSPNNTVLASTTSTTLPFSFTNVALDVWTWIITVSSLSNPASGSWTNNDPSITEEEGTWSAGATIDTDADEEAAAAAS
jgi:hypothetical protein